MANEYQDINALLATLSSYAASSNTTQQGQTVNSTPQTQLSLPYDLTSQDRQRYAIETNQITTEQQNLHGAQYGLHQGVNQTSLPQPLRQHDSSQGPAVSSHFISPRDRPRLELPGTDARTIIEWRQGLRHVNKIAASNDAFGDRISKLIANQLDNERQWWFGREALVEKQKQRVADKQELDNILHGIGATRTEGNTQGKDEESDAAELKRYDLKVHKAMTDMAGSINAELEALGVPFFGTKESLILEDTVRYAGGEASGKISRSELRRLRRKMIEHLEDLYKE